jgi:hypothetical protein
VRGPQRRAGVELALYNNYAHVYIGDFPVTTAVVDSSTKRAMSITFWTTCYPSAFLEQKRANLQAWEAVHKAEGLERIWSYLTSDDLHWSRSGNDY